ncbi:MAG: alpha-glucosidase/alpha-galactosidase [Magnetospirillum sp. WYHS-4]
MANTTKIVFIGAGSMSFGLSMFRDLFLCRDLAGSTLTLVDSNPEALDRMTRLAEIMNARSGTGMKIEKTADRRAALDGAGFVMSSVAIDRNRLWKQDFAIPKKHGIRHTLGENGGPGGLFFTLRTLPLVFDFARDIEELCPDAQFINFSNPESRIVLALNKYTKVKTIGLCHGIFMSTGDIAYVLGRDFFSLDVWAAGLNHFQWVLQLRDKATGEDLYPLLREKEKSHDPKHMPLSRRLLKAFGHWPTCSDDHMGEYVAFGWEGGEHGYDFTWDEGNRASLKKALDGVLDRDEPLPGDWLTSSGERGVHVIEGILNNRHRVVESAIVYNQGAIPNLPADLAVEVPVVVDAGGVHPVSLGPLPDPIAKLLLQQASVQQLAVEAAVHADKDLALQALLVDPVINSTTAAAALLDELWEINKPYIRKCV